MRNERMRELHQGVRIAGRGMVLVFLHVTELPQRVLVEREHRP
jgi:hypothetical protein